MFEGWSITKEQLAEERYQIELYDARAWCNSFPEYEVIETDAGYAVVERNEESDIPNELDESFIDD